MSKFIINAIYSGYMPCFFKTAHSLNFQIRNAKENHGISFLPSESSVVSKFLDFDYVCKLYLWHNAKTMHQHLTKIFKSIHQLTSSGGKK